MDQITLQEKWGEVKMKLKQKYANLTDNDLAYIHGRMDEVFGQIQRKTGVSHEEIERYLREECCC